MSSSKASKGAIKGNPPTLEWLAIDQLQVDPAYQRATDGPQSRKIIVGMVKEWDWTLCQPLVVSRRENGDKFILDGQHRHAGARERGDIPHLPCVILSGCDGQTEAQTFVSLNTARQRLSQTDIFNGMLAAGDPEAVAMAGVIRETGWKIAKGSNAASYGAGHLSCAPMLVTAAKAYGLPPVRNALTALREAYPDTAFNNAATLLKALILIFRRDDLASADCDTFIEAVGIVAPDDWEDARREVSKANPSLSRIEAMAEAMLGNYREYEMDQAA